MKHHQLTLETIELHVVKLGSGPAVVFCHGFPDVWRGWRRQMEAVAAGGYRAVALDMRGYGRSSAPDEPSAYTPLHTVGDLVRVLDALGEASATLVGHDFGASVAWNAALMRPDRFNAVFGVSVPYAPRGDASVLDTMRRAGRTTFYMFDQIRPEADAAWADAAVTYPAALYWASASPPPADRWNPFDRERRLNRPAPYDPEWEDADDMAFAISKFVRTGFRGGLNYYRAIDEGFALTKAFKGAAIKVPSFFVIGDADGLNAVRQVTEESLRAALPGLRGFLRLPEVGHWPHREAPDVFNRALLRFPGEVA